MSKKGVSKISGNPAPKVGEKTTYMVTDWYPATPAGERNPALVIWELFKKRSNGSFTTTNIKKKGDGSFTFGEVASKNTYRLEAYLHEPEGSGPTTIDITPQPAGIPKINRVELRYVDDTPGTVFSYTEKMVAVAYCVNLTGEKLLFTLWEDDAAGEGHNSKNKFVDSRQAVVGRTGTATAEFILTKALMQKSAQGERDPKELEFYVTVEYYKDKKHASDNVELKNPAYRPPVQQPAPAAPVKGNSPAPVPKAPAKAPGSPAASKPASQKEESGIFDAITESLRNKWNELWDWAESKGTVKPDKKPTPAKPEGKTTSVVDQTPKEVFSKVIGPGKEAVLYISSEIATEIKVDKAGKLISYPDYGGYNGMEEYKEDNKIFSKKISSSKSAFPLYKMYIYRGNKIGEAVKKLKQDLKFKTHENAEATVLTVARHAQTNNKNYGSSGPIPPNTIDSLYRIRYMQARNHANKESFRYRFVDNNAANLKVVKDLKDEVSSGAMTLGSRSSISIDPWKSKDLIGCVGVRSSDGENHSSYATEIKDLSAANYKFVYHALNNYLESVVPELTGVYGRRGYSSNGKIAVSASAYEEEIKVFALIDPLPEIDNCNCDKVKKDGRKEYYDSFGTKVISHVSSHTSANKFKGLYMIAQRRQENGFSLKTPLNNPMNIKGSGDAGKKSMATHETYNGKYEARVESFANFTSEEAGFDGYIELLKKNFPDAHHALTDNSKSIDDFVAGLEDTGLKGAYATGEPKNGLTGTQQYKKAVKDNFNSTLNDYKNMLACKLCKSKDEKEKAEIKKDIELLKQLK